MAISLSLALALWIWCLRVVSGDSLDYTELDCTSESLIAKLVPPSCFRF
jgi:hypothetical protein